jgi:hypothetical protein
MRAVNLIPAEQRSGAAVGAGRSEGAAYGVLVLLAGVAVLALIYGLADHQISSRRAEAATLTARSQRAQAQASQLAPYASFVALREQRTQAVAQLVNSRFDWAHAFHELGRVLPLEVSVTSLTGTVGSASGSSGASGASGAATKATGGAVTSATPPGSVPLFTLTGCAFNQPSVALMLERLRLIDGVSEVNLQSSTKAAGSGGGGSASGGGCASGEPQFSVQIVFSGLPAATAKITGTTETAAARSPASATPATATGTTAGTNGGAR